MSARFLSTYVYDSPYGPLELVCHYKFERASFAQKYDARLGGGKPICNGCGPSGLGSLVPDKVNGVRFTICGDIHDWGYQWGLDEGDKISIDGSFGKNMYTIIHAAYAAEVAKIRKGPGGPVRWLRLKIAEDRKNDREEMADGYLATVQVFGGEAFYRKRKINFNFEDIA